MNRQIQTASILSPVSSGPIRSAWGMTKSLAGYSMRNETPPGIRSAGLMAITGRPDPMPENGIRPAIGSRGFNTLDICQRQGG